VIGLQRWLDQTNLEKNLLRLIGLVMMVIEGHDLWQNFKTWTPVSAARAVVSSPFISNQWVVANHPDPAYITAVIVGTVISIFSIALVLFLAFRFHRQSIKIPARIVANPQSFDVR